MKITYDPQADAMYMRLRQVKIDESDEVSPGIIIDYDEKKRPVGIEILDASKVLGRKRELDMQFKIGEEVFSGVGQHKL